MVEARQSVARAVDLIGLFHAPGENFASVRGVSGDEVPEPYRGLLDHPSHMTVAMERHHGGPVRLEVVQVLHPAGAADSYAREILLRKSDGGVVQFGIVRLALAAVDPETASAIRAARVPLGRLLIGAGLLREVHHVGLLEVVPGPGLSRLLGMDHPGPKTFGRVAEISLAGRPAVELLEIAAPLDGRRAGG